MRLKAVGLVFAAGLIAGVPASAAPLLQLDIAGARYDSHSKTIVATGNSFTLYALLTPKERDDVSKRLDKTYYISAALSPQVMDPANLGSFTWNGSTVQATEDMVHGKPPMESFGDLQGHDAGDLGNHSGIYPTYFAEFAFQFSGLTRVATYDSAVDRSGPVADPNGGSYLAAFTVDTSMLNPNYVIHFDLYNAKARECGAQESQMVDDPSCSDVDIASFAPFSHDAQSPPVPEPASLLLLGAGLGAGAFKKYRKRQQLA
jgi:hypothetical protein